MTFQDKKKIRLLVVIASFGMKNIEFLKKIIRRYKRMTMDVDIVVTSEAPKKLESGVKLVVGLPCKDPWSLPFAHKKIFAEYVDQYDLFAYSEDDMEVTEENILAFIRVTQKLTQNEIAGFLRYEVDKDGTLSLLDVHGPYHWKPNTVRRRGAHILAEFSNEHAAFFLLTRQQLKTAIASGGFIKNPYEGRHDMMCSAATDPYTSCGFQKIICISALDDFLVHHMSNRYAGQMGIPLSSFREQIQTLMDIRKGIHPVSILCEVEPKVLQRNWYKSYYEPPDIELLEMVPKDAKTILSVGCGWGATEAELKKRGYDVTALPLDSVIGAVAECLGLEMVYGTIEEGLRALQGRKFDCVIITNLLHLLPYPWQVLSDYTRLVGNGGALVISGPNFEFFPHLAKRFLAIGDYRKLRHFDRSGLHAHGIRTIRKQIEEAGFRVSSSSWVNLAQPRKGLMLQRWPKWLVARDWIIQARHKP